MGRKPFQWRWCADNSKLAKHVSLLVCMLHPRPTIRATTTTVKFFSCPNHASVPTALVSTKVPSKQPTINSVEDDENARPTGPTTWTEATFNKGCDQGQQIEPQVRRLGTFQDKRIYMLTPPSCCTALRVTPRPGRRRGAVVSEP